MKQAALFSRVCQRAIPLGLVFVLGLAAASVAHAISGAGVEIGHGNDNTDIARISARWDWDKRWGLGQGWIAGGYWESGLGYMAGDGVDHRNIWEVGLTPVVRLRSGLSRFYLEGGVGAHLFSETRINAGRDFGTSLQIGSHVGFGWNFGDKDRYELGYRLQHLSNGSLKEPNHGINFHLIRLGYNY